MRLIEPCCAAKQFMLLRDAIGKNGKTQFEGYGDLSLTEILPAILTRYSETEMMIVAPRIPDQAANVISQWLHKSWARMDGRGKIDCLSKLTIMADLSGETSPLASTWLTSNLFGSRLSLVNRKTNDTALLLPDIAITGPLNMQYDSHFVCTVTTIPSEVLALWKEYARLTRRSRRFTHKSTEADDYENEQREDER